MLSINPHKIAKKDTLPVSSDIYLVTGLFLFWGVHAFLAPAPFCGGPVTPPHPRFPPHLHPFARPPQAAAAEEAADAAPAIAATRAGWPSTLAAPGGGTGTPPGSRGTWQYTPGWGGTTPSTSPPSHDDDDDDDGGGCLLDAESLERLRAGGGGGQQRQ